MGHLRTAVHNFSPSASRPTSSSRTRRTGRPPRHRRVQEGELSGATCLYALYAPATGVSTLTRPPRARPRSPRRRRHGTLALWGWAGRLRQVAHCGRGTNDDAGEFTGGRPPAAAGVAARQGAQMPVAWSEHDRPSAADHPLPRTRREGAGRSDRPAPPDLRGPPGAGP
ncbi:hypothetical protein [Streptomyces pinistramenti]|uniref:hypothetical protein n=1 Tax=Streptomyces pinistramenti TaxID=2884812 RepID=UPI00222283B5|nr:hypothetical protein [Streptomyces pinistramenti]